MFSKVKPNPQSIANRKPICGVGINDSDYITSKKINGKNTMCPYYRAWTSMLTRCYSLKYQAIAPTYKGCSVCDEWVVFSRFKKWMKKQEWKGMCLDKDIINPNNKLYSPENCVFVTYEINNLITFNKKESKSTGVHFNSDKGLFVVQISMNKKRKNMGYFKTKADALEVYNKAKYDYLILISSQQKNKRIARGIAKHAKLFKEQRTSERLH